MDLEELYKVDNVAVFTRGLRDMTKSKDNVPMLFSQPHYLMADSMISDTLKMKPEKMKHQSLVCFVSYYLIIFFFLFEKLSLV